LFEHLLFSDKLEDGIAFEASGKNSEIRQREFVSYLIDLTPVVIALDQKYRDARPTCREATVPGQDDAVFGFRNADDLVIVVHVRVSDVDAEHAQPAGELPDHYIGDKFLFVHIRRGT
jgi:hypothetical protein